MIEDESEPSLYSEFNFSTTSSIFSEDDDCTQSKQLKRRQSVSLHNVSSTPYTQQIAKPVYNRFSSQRAVGTTRKPKRNRYDHIESKVKRDLIESNRQQEARKREREQLRKVKEDDTDVDVKPESDQLDIQLLSTRFITLEEKYSETLNKIDSLQLEVDKIKCDKSLSVVTPRTVNRRSNMQTNLIRTLLYNSSTSGHCQNLNTPRMSMFEGDSTCMTLDVADMLPTQEITQLQSGDMSSMNSATVRENPFLIQTLSPASTASSYHSESPLLMNYTERRQSKNKFYKFLYKFLRCPKVKSMKRHKIYNCCARFRNKVYPGNVPKVVIVSPSEDDSDSGNQSDERYNRMFPKISR